MRPRGKRDRGRSSAGWLQRGQHLAIIGENRPRLYFTMTAVQCLGAIPVPMYQDAAAAEMAFVFDNAEIHFAVVEDQEQVDKVLEIREKVPHLQQIFYDDARGLRHYEQPGLQPYEALRASGQNCCSSSPPLIERRNKEGPLRPMWARCSTRRGRPEMPKVSCSGYDNLISAGRAGAEMEAAERQRKKSSRICRWRGSARIFFRTRSGWCAGLR